MAFEEPWAQAVDGFKSKLCRHTSKPRARPNGRFGLGYRIGSDHAAL